MLLSPENHPKFPPHTWAVEKRGRQWALLINGHPIGHYDTKKAAEADKVSGPWVQLYEKERRWYAGEQIPGWRPFNRGERTTV